MVKRANWGPRDESDYLQRIELRESRHGDIGHTVKQMRTLQLKVKPNARSQSLIEGKDGVWLARLKSPPVDGKANAELITLIADRFDCRKKDVTIKAGAGGRMKLVTIAD